MTRWTEKALNPRLDLGSSVAKEVLGPVIAVLERWQAAHVPFWSELFRPRTAGATFYDNDMLSPEQVAEVLHCRLQHTQWAARTSSAASVRGFGRVLLLDLDAVDCDGFARVASGGYFDSSGVPPWETWLSIDVADSGENEQQGPTSARCIDQQAVRSVRR